MKKIFLLCLCLVVGCTDEDGSRRALDGTGFTEISFTGYNYFGCGKGDDFHTGFRAKNINGKVVTGVVCCGWLKDCTVRF